jgi:predicted transcriptional regulator
VYDNLSELHESGIVKKMAFKGKTIYYPDGLRSDDVETAFSQLRVDARRTMFMHVLNNPGCMQNDVIKAVTAGMSDRQAIRHLHSLVDAGLISSVSDGNRVIYNIGDVGRKIVLGSFETIDPLIINIKKKLGHDIAISTDQGSDTVTIDLMNGDSLVIHLGTWTVMDIDENVLFNNISILLGDGGEKVLVAVYNGCTAIPDISAVTAIPEPVVRSKINTLRVMKLVVDRPGLPREIEITASGKKMVDKLFGIERKKMN